MTFIKNPLDFFKKDPADGKQAVEDRAIHAHPDLMPGGYYALAKEYAPVVVSSHGISCRIEHAHGEYVVTTHSHGRLILQEHLNARDRKKLFVSAFDFKGLVGIHLHPAGMVLALALAPDVEKNALGAARQEQPPATIVSGPVPPNDGPLRAGRVMTIDPAAFSEGSPLLIAVNNRLLHIMVKPMQGIGTAVGVYLSNINGVVRGNALPVAVLQRLESVVIDRQFFIRQAANPDASITARAWSMEIIDPVIMRLTMNAAGLLILEELFTTHGLSVVVGGGQPVQLGLLGYNSAPREEALRAEYAGTLGKLRDRTRFSVAEQGQAERLQGIRDQLLAEVARAIRKENADGVVMLALELAVKEVVAPLCNEASGNDLLTTVTHDTVSFLNAVVDELAVWIQTDSSVALSAAAIDQVIGEMAGELPMPGLDAMMRQALPRIQAACLEEEQLHFEDLCRRARQFLAGFLSASRVSRDVHHLARQLTHTNDQEEQQALRADLEQAVQKMMRETVEQTLIRLCIRGHLPRIEQEKRQELGIVLQQANGPLLKTADLDDIIKRYNGYVRYIEPAFQERLRAPLNQVIQNFQEGTSKESVVVINMAGFIAGLAHLRSSGGKPEGDDDAAVPTITCLHTIPDAVPDIQVAQPDRGMAKGYIRVVHREGQLLETDFALMLTATSLPPGVPDTLWFVFEDFAAHFMAFHLDAQRKVDQKHQDLIARQLTRILLLKFFNLLRGLYSLPVAIDFTGIQAFLGEADGVAAMRLGEHLGEELLDLRDRPAGMLESAMNLKHELRQIVVKLEKDAVIPADAFRFKQRMRAFATAGGGELQVLLPATITARRGKVTIEADFDGQSYKNSVRLAGQEDESGAEPADQPPLSVEQKRAHREMVRAQTEKLSRQGIAQLLDGLEFFKHFSNYEKDRVAEFNLSFKLVMPQEVVIQANTLDTAFFILIKGSVAATRGIADRAGKALFILKAGEIMGEMAFLTGEPRTMNIVAQEKALLLRVDSELLEQLSCDSREKFKDQLINKLVQRLADTTSRVQKMVRAGPAGPHRPGSREPGQANQGECKQFSRQEAVEKIEQIPFFELFSPFEKRRITAFNTAFYTYPANTHIICEGDIDTAFFILIDGTVAVVKGETEIVTLGPGEFFGDMAFLTSLPRTTGVYSKTEILVLKVDQDLLQRLGSEVREKLKDRLIRTLCERLIQTTGTI
ncbi:MAG: cyclic nucleotide-binding domain-containing protein [Magnetococcus sp. DMHC-8]